MGNRPIRCLVAEDDRDVKLILDMILEHQGFEVVNAYNGREAVEQYKAHRPDLVLMDILMPEMRGDRAIEEIKQYHPEAQVIAVTAFNYREEDLGVPVLRKGFTVKELLDTLRERFDLSLDCAP